VKRKALGDKVTLSADDYEKVADLAKKQIAAENDKTEMADAVERLTEENDELLQDVAKLREINKTLVSEKTALQKAVDRLEKSLRSVQEEVSFWKWKFNKAMEFLERHSLKRKWEELGGKRNRGR
jgi:regulator of replication initiation timing